MTVSSDIVRIRIPPDYFKNWKSKTHKVDLICHGYDNYTQEQIIQLAACSQDPVLNNAGSTEDIEIELESMPVVQDGVKPQKTTPKRLRLIETFVDHPGFDGDRDFIRSRFRNIREHWVNHQELVRINQDLRKLGYTRGIQNFKKKYVHPKNPNQIFYCIEVGECEYG